MGRMEKKQMFLCQSLSGASDGKCCFFHEKCHGQLQELAMEKRRDIYRKALQIAVLLTMVLAGWFVAWSVVVPKAAGGGGKVAATHRLLTERRNVQAPLTPATLGMPPQIAAFSTPNLQQEDVFISVKTSRKFHRKRLDVIIKTWFQLAATHTWFFTDSNDQEFDQKTGGHLRVTACPSTHSRQALCCKMAAEFDAFLNSDKKWFCHFDDDNYVNVPALISKLSEFDYQQDFYLGKPSIAQPLEILDRDSQEKVSFLFATGGAGFCLSRSSAMRMAGPAGGGRFEAVGDKIRLPDDVTMGYVAERLADTPLTVVPEFHSHLETQGLLQEATFADQISFSYSELEQARPNVVSLRLGKFDQTQDPTRFMSLHCQLFPHLDWCRNRP